MNLITIDKKFFKLDSNISKGLISGLKKLQQNGFQIRVDDLNLGEKNELNKILELEGIVINQNDSKTNRKNGKNFSLMTSGDPGSCTIILNEKGEINTFEKGVSQILRNLRTAKQRRKTKETDIEIEVNLDGTGGSIINTGIGFFDHMLEQIAKHANVDLKINVTGDLHVDEHHTVEDVGITLGNVLIEALGSKKGIKRYGYFLPMDDSIARCALDLGGRAFLNFKCKFSREKVGEFPTELTEEFFRGLSSGLKANIFIRAKGKNDHHKIEAMFKAFAKSLNEACRMDERNKNMLPSTKGML
ncbi:MAG: imidazoleglycerol-phosphate dehydratase HisB [Ignavibacteriaceae bacterium]